MQILTTISKDAVKIDAPLVVVLGNFDGIHIAHQRIIQNAVDYAKYKGCKAAVMTFEPHPKMYFDRAAENFRLTSYKEKREIFQNLGVDLLFELPFVKEVADLSAVDFIQNILDQFDIKAIITGYDFHFGKGRMGSCDTLVELAQKYGFEYSCIEPQYLDKAIISSSSIRQALRDGQPEAAKALLGRYFSLQGEVVHGRALGRTIGFPTANLLPQEYLLPRFGVYAAKSKIEGEDIWRNTIVNIGKRPTVQGVRTFIEAHLIDWEGDLYGKDLMVGLLHFIRTEMKFDGIKSLQNQIQKDMIQARKILKNITDFNQ